MPVRLKQALVATAGVAIAVVMLWLGLWQMKVYESKEESSAQERAALAPVPLLDNVFDDGTVGDVYGRQVAASGSYLASQEVLIDDGAGTVRVLTALELADGRVLPVVRGVTAGRGQPPSSPAGEVEVVGVFLPSEPGTDRPLGSVRLPALAQQWPQRLLPGFLTLSPDAATAQGLQPAQVNLSTGEGSWQNYGYALQWWVFAAFAAFMTARFVRAIGREGILGDADDPLVGPPVDPSTPGMTAADRRSVGSAQPAPDTSGDS